MQPSCTAGEGGKHPWGWPAGCAGAALGPAIFIISDCCDGRTVLQLNNARLQGPAGTGKPVCVYRQLAEGQPPVARHIASALSAASSSEAGQAATELPVDLVAELIVDEALGWACPQWKIDLRRPRVDDNADHQPAMLSQDIEADFDEEGGDDDDEW